MIGLEHLPRKKPVSFDKSVKVAAGKIKNIVDYAARKFPESADFDAAWKRSKYLLAAIQLNSKCAYCESRIGAGSYGDVEHFRPKTEVCEFVTRGDRDDTKGRSAQREVANAYQPGYWWLAYDWENYVFACGKCNTWKSNSFPLKGGRNIAELQPGDESREQPLLINPYFLDPASHFAWDEIGSIRGETPEGEATIECCGLDRESLRLERERIANRILEIFDDLGSGLLRDEVAIRYLLGYCGDAEPYAGMARSLVANRMSLTSAEVAKLASAGTSSSG